MRPLVALVPALIATSFVACGAEPAAQDASDPDASDAASAAACDAIAIPCCQRDEAIASCAPTADRERWFCGAAEIGTAAYGAHCRAGNPASCPAGTSLSTWLDGTSCPAGAVGDACWYAATAGGVGTDGVVCTCGGYGWSCAPLTRAIYGCLEPTPPVDPTTRGAPRAAELVPGAACSDPADEPREATCVPAQQDDGRFCASNADCAGGGVCLDTHTFGPGSACTCAYAACLSNADCGANRVCQCGRVTADARCGGWGHLPCAHRCVPADCRSDADCAPGGRCTASWDYCGWQVERYACHYPDRGDCWNDAECGANSVCRYVPDADAWCCQSSPLCE